MSADDESCLALWRVLFRASRLLEERIRRATASRGLGASDFAVLDALREQGPLAVNVLGERVALTSGSITTAVDRLSARGLVARRARRQDARSRLVALRPAGRRLIDCAIADHARALSGALAALTPYERGAALALLSKLIAAEKSLPHAT
jgi:MarR family 2-MHQ and catechol resistance regulon transcriptional repressor